MQHEHASGAELDTSLAVRGTNSDSTQSDSHSKSRSSEVSSSLPSTCKLPTPANPVFQFGWFKITVLKTSIFRVKANVWVNPANNKLQNDGGLAAVYKERCEDFQLLCDQYMEYVRKGVPLNVSDAVVAFEQRLQINPSFAETRDFFMVAIVHAVGPIWNDSNKEQCDQQLSQTIKNIMKVVMEHKFNGGFKVQHVAIPMISTGIFQYPSDRAARIIFQAVWEIVKLIVQTHPLERFFTKPTGHLSEVTLVIHPKDSAANQMETVIIEEMQKAFYSIWPMRARG